MSFNVINVAIFNGIFDEKLPREFINNCRVIDLCSMNIKDVFPNEELRLSCWGTYYKDHIINDFCDFFKDRAFYEQIAFIVKSNKKMLFLELMIVNFI